MTRVDAGSRGKWAQLTHEDQAEHWIRAYDQGFSSEEIGQAWGVSGQTVRVYLTRSGIRMRKRSDYRRRERA